MFILVQKDFEQAVSVVRMPKFKFQLHSPFQLPANVRWEREGDGFTSWVPHHPNGRLKLKFSAPGFDLAQLWLLQTFGESTSRQETTVSILN